MARSHAAGIERPQDYYDIAGLAQATGVSTRTVRRWIDDAVNPLPSHAVRVGGNDRGRVLILRAEFEAWVRQFPPGRRAVAAPAPDPDMAERVAAAVRSMRG